jgi:hypothetical protein
MMGSAKRTLDYGLAASGHRYIDLDDGWTAKRRLPTDTRSTARRPSSTTVGFTPARSRF